VFRSQEPNSQVPVLVCRKWHQEFLSTSGRKHKLNNHYVFKREVDCNKSVWLRDVVPSWRSGQAGMQCRNAWQFVAGGSQSRPEPACSAGPLREVGDVHARCVAALSLGIAGCSGGSTAARLGRDSGQMCWNCRRKHRSCENGDSSIRRAVLTNGWCYSGVNFHPVCAS